MAEETVPKHIAIIMDGNGRWAKARGLERLYGHMEGVESIRKVVKAAIRRGVEYLTVYAFSTENWGRPEDEIAGLMELFCKCTVNETPELKKQGVRLRFIGDIGSMSEDVRTAVAYCQNETAENRKLTLVIALNYSARWELTRMAQLLAAEAVEGKIAPEQVTDETVSQHLSTAGIPDPDLIVRTSGEYRLSNFLLWQAAYSEFYFTDVLWPDFDGEEFDKAIASYAQRDRRFGRVK